MSQLNSSPPGEPAARITLGPCEGGDLYWSPVAGQVPVEGTAAVILGWTVDGLPVVLATGSIGYLDDLEEAIRVARAQGIVRCGMKVPA